MPLLRLGMVMNDGETILMAEDALDGHMITTVIKQKEVEVFINHKGPYFSVSCLCFIFFYGVDMTSREG